MFNRAFDHNKPLRAVIYARMSSEKQNKHSPEQQIFEINQRIAMLRYPWTVVKTYTDIAVSGRCFRKRREFQQMLNDIRSKRISVDLIIVDTFERLGRTDDLATLRKEFREHHGVLILTADSNFADPTTPQGQAYNSFEAMRATEENRIKCHQVLRGKRDLVRRGYWPGGPPPFGYGLVSCLAENQGRKSIEGSKLEIVPEQADIIKKLFERALETGHGCSRLAMFLNQHPEIPESYKPFNEPTVRYWLNQSIYYGEIRWEQNTTDLINDARVIERNPEEKWVRYPDFCEPIISKEVSDQVSALRLRRKRIQVPDDSATPEKQIKPLAGGVSLTYPLSGLVVCGECRSALRPIPSGRKSRDGKSYMYYACPMAITSQSCSNIRYLPERWLWKIVIEKLMTRILDLEGIQIPEGSDEITSAPENSIHFIQKAIQDSELNFESVCSKPWFQELTRLVNAELSRMNLNRDSNESLLDDEQKELRTRLQGWMISLSNPELPIEVRELIVLDSVPVSKRIQEIDRIRKEKEFRLSQMKSVVDPEALIERLERLWAVLAQYNPSRINVELSLHIDKIEWFGTGKVKLKLCKLGLTPDAIDLFQMNLIEHRSDLEINPQVCTVKPRRRSLRMIHTGESPSEELHSLVSWSTDPGRFDDLHPDFFEEHEFQLPEPIYWFQKHAIEILNKRKEGMSHAELAARSGCSLATVRKALNYALALDPDQERFRKKHPRRRWHEDHVNEIVALVMQNHNIPSIAKQLGKSEPTIKKGIQFASECGLL